ncbi:hypothetical protein K431DRAFT_336130 [Polychaeton citri CBS 116435]|uniref:STE24 endopeptidase n=1 Tax=Polychaeton citri CBS 116435 TaxID=1314669 RepID=A0A9P4QE75_9PEZI|nr:hypothetical protein K431DRAFT_336130 [Polychaeton citri CBS 116435]
MPTPIDRAMNSRNFFLGFAGIVTAAAAWSIWGQGDMFPKEADPKGDPQEWTDDELLRWLRNRNLYPTGKETRDELLARVEANLRAPRT